MTINETQQITTDFHSQRRPQSQQTHLYVSAACGCIFVVLGVLYIVFWWYSKYLRMRVYEIEEEDVQRDELLSAAIQTFRNEFPTDLASTSERNESEVEENLEQEDTDYTVITNQIWDPEITVLKRRSE